MATTTYWAKIQAHATRGWHLWLALTILVLGVVGSQAAGRHLVGIEEQARDIEFADLAHGLAADLEADLNGVLIAVGGVADVATIGGLGNGDAVIAAAVLARERVPALAAIGVMRAVGDVAAHEAGRSDDLTIKPTRQGPAIFLERVEPLEGNEGAIGFDLLSERHRAAALAMARDLAAPVASAPVQVVPVRQGAGLSAVVFLPVYVGGRPPVTEAGRRAAFVGGLSAVLAPREAIGRMASDDVRLEVWDAGARNQAGDVPVHMASSDGRVVSDLGAVGPRRIVEIEIANRRWQLIVDGIGFAGGGSVWLGTGLPVAGAVIALLLAALVLVGGTALQRSGRDRDLLALRDQERVAVVGAFGDGYLRVGDDLAIRSASGDGWTSAVGQRIHQAIPGSPAGRALEVLVLNVLQTGRPQSADLLLPAEHEAGTPAGDEVVLEARATAVGDAVAVSLRDVSVRARMEHELRGANEDVKQLATALEKRVEQRTAELGRITEDLELANRELERFVYMAAHELRTPLTMLVGTLAWFDEYLAIEADSLERDLLDRSRAAARRMTDRIDTLVEEAHGVASGQAQVLEQHRQGLPPGGTAGPRPTGNASGTTDRTERPPSLVPSRSGNDVDATTSAHRPGASAYRQGPT